MELKYHHFYYNKSSLPDGRSQLLFTSPLYMLCTQTVKSVLLFHLFKNLVPFESFIIQIHCMLFIWGVFEGNGHTWEVVNQVILSKKCYMFSIHNSYGVTAVVIWSKIS